MHELSFREVWKARKRIEPFIQPTPLLYSEALSEQTGANVYLKLEHDHPTGSFKLRGAANKILSLKEEDRQKGVTTFSTGNHGISVAYMAAKLNIPCTVCISNHVPPAKVNRLKKLQARVEITGVSQDDAEARCVELEKEEGMTIIKPFDDKEVIAGQGTIGLEIMSQCPDVDEVIIPLSGGGLLSGIAFVMKSIEPAVHVTGITMKKAAVMQESLAKGKPVILEEEPTLADSLLGGIGTDNRFTFPMTRMYMDEGVRVDESQIEEGLLYILNHHKIVIEGAAATGIGHILYSDFGEGKNIVAVLSGNNIDHEVISDLIHKS
ncbi:threonine/serine dehydratase [Halobacillus karajensis]|uniref:threonine ammonia-lyase n=1 Tax=Halobacillus karajensis TaxID=195088 RepID=A0A059NYM1_9BACI|nr:threonine/serine dehydratase [Halobacillus karajensis]CDQ18612.1 L-threonine dehydratase catabolic TdcB [Halobacillus karajensis]CDQ23316.1 L-threonine dehydratase catabolic TdcB [Halobacillus karajensis]CDQ26798.1 L-threonine dehydratase catabolic TdcB [Halobacillus karajensis]